MDGLYPPLFTVHCGTVCAIFCFRSHLQRKHWEEDLLNAVSSMQSLSSQQSLFIVCPVVSLYGASSWHHAPAQANAHSIHYNSSESTFDYILDQDELDPISSTDFLQALQTVNINFALQPVKFASARSQIQNFWRKNILTTRRMELITPMFACAHVCCKCWCIQWNRSTCLLM